MLRIASRLIFMTALAVGGAVVLFVYQDQNGERHQRIEAEHKNEQLKQVIGRLSAERRMADVVVTDQKTVDGKTRTTLLFVEYAADGTGLPAKRFTIDGSVAY